LDNSASFILSGTKDLHQKWKIKLTTRGTGTVWRLDLTNSGPIFYHRSTPPGKRDGNDFETGGRHCQAITHRRAHLCAICCHGNNAVTSNVTSMWHR